MNVEIQFRFGEKCDWNLATIDDGGGMWFRQGRMRSSFKKSIKCNLVLQRKLWL